MAVATKNAPRQRNSKGKGKPKPVAPPQLTARELLKEDHPLHSVFRRWVLKRAETTGENGLSVRKARKFLSDFPQYRTVVAA